MATTVISTACPTGTWTPLATGSASLTSARLSAAGGNLKVAVATSTPAANTDTWFMILRDQPLQDVELSTSDIVYGMGVTDGVIARGFSW